MPRFFFDFHQAGQREIDLTGCELADVEQAYLEVLRTVQDMWSELLKQRRDPRQCSFVVRSEEGYILFDFPFQEAVDCCNHRLHAPIGNMLKEAGQTRAYANRMLEGFRQEIQASHQILKDARNLLRQDLG
jgi:hypothetical protein